MFYYVLVNSVANYGRLWDCLGFGEHIHYCYSEAVLFDRQNQEFIIERRRVSYCFPSTVWSFLQINL